MTDPTPPIAALVEAGVAAWPALRIDCAAFRRHLEALEPPSLEHAGDLALAFACSLRGEEAMRQLDPVLRGAVAKAIARFDPSPGFADDVSQKLREGLLLSDPPKIGTYAGRAALRSWLRMAALRAALNLRRRREDDANARQTLTTSAPNAPVDSDLAYLRSRYKEEFARALKAAVARLPVKDRRMLRAYVVERVTLEALADTHRVGISTVSRWLKAIRERLALDAKAALREGLRMTASEYDGIAEAVRSELDVSIAALLRSSS
jgi:RNA polymerase sigma-70 factor (ECF subfamily)